MLMGVAHVGTLSDCFLDDFLYYLLHAHILDFLLLDHALDFLLLNHTLDFLLLDHVLHIHQNAVVCILVLLMSPFAFGRNAGT